jgi:hypothetical protein
LSPYQVSQAVGPSAPYFYYASGDAAVISIVGGVTTYRQRYILELRDLIDKPIADVKFDLWWSSNGTDIFDVTFSNIDVNAARDGWDHTNLLYTDVVIGQGGASIDVWAHFWFDPSLFNQIGDFLNGLCPAPGCDFVMAVLITMHTDGSWSALFRTSGENRTPMFSTLHCCRP